MNAPRIGEPARGTTSGRPLMVLLDTLGRRGALRILWELKGVDRLTFRALQEACESNPGVLNTRLKELRSLGLVAHEPGGYHLSTKGRELAALFGPLSTWAESWARETKAPN